MNLNSLSALFSGVLVLAWTGGLNAQDVVIPTEVSNSQQVVGTAEWVTEGDLGSCQYCSGIEADWAFQFDLFFMTRDKPNRMPLLFSDGGTPGNYTDDNMLATTTDLDFRWEPGFRLSAGRSFDNNKAFEITYFELQDLNDSLGRTGAGNIAWPWSVGTTVDFQDADFASASYASDLHNLEFNLRSQVKDAWSVLAGLRYVSIDEQFRGVSNNLDGDGLSSVYNTDTENDLFGIQVGTNNRFALLEDLTLDVDTAAGLFVNSAWQQTFATDEGAVWRQTGDRRNKTAFVGELRLNGVYALSENVGLRVGYQLLWVAGIALAPEQLDYSNNAFSATDVSVNGKSLYQGFNIGFEYVR